MFLRTKTAIAAATIAFIAFPASSAVIDILVTASVSETFRSGIFNKDEVNLSSHTEVVPELDGDIPTIFESSAIGDTVEILWKMDTTAGQPFDTTEEDLEDKSDDGRWGYPQGPMSTTFTLNGESWTVDGNEGSDVRYLDKSGQFRLSYSAFDLPVSPFTRDLGMQPWSDMYHETLINVRPEEYVTRKGIMNTFDMSGSNLGTGYLNLDSHVMVGENFEDVFSTLRIDYKVTSIKTSMQDIKVASMPLPPGVLLITSGLLGIRLLRRRKT